VSFGARFGGPQRVAYHQDVLPQRFDGVVLGLAEHGAELVVSPHCAGPAHQLGQQVEVHRPQRYLDRRDGQHPAGHVHPLTISDRSP